jgi:agmatine/peptidylarginine deiminase
MMNVVFVTVPTDTYWVRDYGPWFIRAFEAGKPVVRIVDVRYKEILTRPNDDRVPALMAVQLNQSTHYDLRTVCQGGNFMTDSVGSAASTTRLMDDNPSSSLATIQDSFRNVLGVQNYFLVDDPGYPTNYIEHVDCWCKFIGPKKVLVKRVPTSDPLYYAFETAASLWAERTNLLGEKYDVIRIDGPMNSFYLNQVILNDRVFVPAHATPDDALAISQIQAAYGPRFRVFPVLAAAGLPWLMTDSLHCRLTSIPVLNVPVL